MYTRTPSPCRLVWQKDLDSTAKIPYKVVPARGRRAPCRNNLSTRPCVCWPCPLVKQGKCGYNIRVASLCAKAHKTPNAVGSAHPSFRPAGGTGLCPVRAQSRRPICDPYPVRCPEKDKLWSEPPSGGFDSACPNQVRRRTKGRGCLSAIPFRLHGRESVTL